MKEKECEISNTILKYCDGPYKVASYSHTGEGPTAEFAIEDLPEMVEKIKKLLLSA